MENISNNGMLTFKLLRIRVQINKKKINLASISAGSGVISGSHFGSQAEPRN